MKKVIVAYLVLQTTLTFGQQSRIPSENLNSYKLNAPLIIDGYLNELLYQEDAIENFTQKDPDEGKPATERTQIWISHDESNIYFSGMFFDSKPDSIDQALMRRDNLTNSDWFWIYMDPYNDDRTGFYFAVNAGGSICDGTLYNDGWMDDSWDGIWESKSKINDKGWATEIRIPFSQLRFKESEEMVWGINLNRDIKRKHEMSFYVMIPSDESGFNSHFADLVGLNGVKPKQRIEILPYLVHKAQYLSSGKDNPYYNDNQHQTAYGADLKFSLGSNLNVDATFNPDFGQVEVDPAIVNLSAFENFYQEKRPFFIEGSNIFQFGYGGANNNWGFNFSNPRLFYSRRIGRAPQGYATKPGVVDMPSETAILGAAKLSGKIDETVSIGAVSAITERTYARINDLVKGTVEEEVEPLTHYGVLRSRKEFNDGAQSLGMIFTSVNRQLRTKTLESLLADEAYTYGLDGWTFLDEERTYVITGSVIGSYVSGSEDYMRRVQQQPYRYFQRPDKDYMRLDSNRTSMSGYFSRVMLNKQEGNFYINSALGVSSPGFEYNDLGSQWFADRLNGHLVLGYRWYVPGEIFRRKNVYLAYNKNTTFGGDVLREGLYFTWNMQFLNFWGIGGNASTNFDAYSTSLTRGGPIVATPQNYSYNFFMHTDNREKVILEPSVGFMHNELGGNYYFLELEFRWKPNPQIDLSIEPEYSQELEETQWVGAFNDPAALNTFGRRYVFAEMKQTSFSADIRLNWTFTPAISLQLYLQPLFVVGDYEKYMELEKGGTSDYLVYGEEGSSTIEYDEVTNSYLADPDGSGSAAGFSFGNRDFNYKSLQGNLVLRWEVLPGSVFYLVWTNSRTNFEDPGEFSFGRDFGNLWKAETDDILLAKFSYWLDI